MSRPTKVQRAILQEMAAGVGIFGFGPDYWLGMHRRIKGRTLDALIGRGWVACDPALRTHGHAITDAGRAALAEAERIATEAGTERIG